MGAALKRSAQAESTFQAAVGEAVEATVIAMPPSPTPKPVVDPYTLTEEELAAMIDASSEEAATAYEQASTATTQATSDGAYTEEEIYDTIYYVYEAEAAIAYTEELLYLYYDLYGMYASEALELLYLIEDDLDDLAYAMTEIEAMLSQGAEAATAAIEQINTRLSNTQAKVTDIRAKVQEHKSKMSSALVERENKYLNISPTEIAGAREGAILQVYAYLDRVKSAFEDRKIFPEELGQIAQLAANAKAGIGQSGGPLLRGFSGKIDNINHKLAHGDWPSAQRDLINFDASIPTRPTRR